ncbi:TonB-dependent receptor [Hymenobacter chitinivorans]|uniref:TonB-dependent receptor-like protein n=1 Tax=Hymenobacter chitinivorans DSM 11115 TaxID=1121954 RepID=A0A2M9BLK2_9BACT|nr:carboxypeptidase-like regulatory domain-containing protein [Hymenobacter chitinivorans]PJJ58829.1 TonB-dependent receptor-like protein [Hymenobacter chitinivorans DSM 11115]
MKHRRILRRGPLRAAGLILLLLSAPRLSPAQSRITLSGTVRDARTGEKLLGAAVFVASGTTGTTTNAAGFYSLTLPSQDSVRLTASYLGYQRQTVVLPARQTATRSFALTADNELAEVRVLAAPEAPLERRVEMSTLQIPVAQLRKLPALLGEPDVLRAFQLMPGVQAGREGSGALYVRGGSPDQNLTLLDDVPIYYVSHIGGFLSVFDAHAISDVRLIKGGFPARYGGRLSSVLDVRLKEGNKQKLSGNAGVGVLATHFALEGPLNKGKTTFLVSGRRGNLDLFSRLASARSSGGKSVVGYSFYDASAKVSHQLTPRDQVFAALYLGGDRLFITQKPQTVRGAQGNFTYQGGSNLRFGNALASVRWNRELTPRLFGNATAAFTRFRYENGQDYHLEDNSPGSTRTEDSEAQFTSGVQDAQLKADFDYYPSPRHQVRFGASIIRHGFTPGVNFFTTRTTTATQDTTFGSSQVAALELSGYAEDEIRLGARLSANLGLRAVRYTVAGRSFGSLQPRVLATWLVGEHTALKASYAAMQQYLHLLSNNGAGLPTDLWVPATARVAPQQAQQVALGVARTLPQWGLEVSVEAFAKRLRHLIEFREGATFYNSSQDWQDKVVTGGQGRVQGLEVLVQRKTGRLTGWVGYTLARNERRFDQLNDQQWYPYKYDRRHDASIVVIYALSARLTLSATWVYGTGNALTLAQANYNVISPSYGYTDKSYIPANRYDYREAEIYGPKNSFRMRAYHRLDVGATFTKAVQHGERIWRLGAYNAYSRHNPYYIYYDQTPEGLRQLKQLSLFPFLPAISYERSF